MRVLFVCLGNICRSPLMEGLARARWIGEAPMEFDSAGLGDWHHGSPPDRRAVAIAARHGVDLRGQRARPVAAGDFAHFDLMLCADATVLAELRRRAPPDAHAELALYLDWCGLPAGGDVPDPYTGGEAEFAHVYALVAAATEGLLRRLRAG